MFYVLSALLSFFMFSGAASAAERSCADFFVSVRAEPRSLSAERSEIRRVVLEAELLSILEHRIAIERRSTINHVESPEFRKMVLGLGERLRGEGLVSRYQIKALEAMLDKDWALLFVRTGEFQRIFRDVVDERKLVVAVDALALVLQAHTPTGRGIQDVSERKRIAQEARSYFRTFEKLNDFQFKAYAHFAGFYRSSVGLGIRGLELGGKPIRVSAGLSNSTFEIILAADNAFKLEALAFAGLYVERSPGTFVAGLGIPEFGPELLTELRGISSWAALQTFKLKRERRF